MERLQRIKQNLKKIWKHTKNIVFKLIEGLGIGCIILTTPFRIIGICVSFTIMVLTMFVILFISASKQHARQTTWNETFTKCK
jgi:hypothetical protein